jgi:hypothetical protein
LHPRKLHSLANCNTPATTKRRFCTYFRPPKLHLLTNCTQNRLTDGVQLARADLYLSGARDKIDQFLPASQTVLRYSPSRHAPRQLTLRCSRSYRCWCGFVVACLDVYCCGLLNCDIARGGVLHRLRVTDDFALLNFGPFVVSGKSVIREKAAKITTTTAPVVSPAPPLTQ